MTLLIENDQIAEFCARAHDEAFITVDTEFLREKTYWPKLCLIQIGLKDQAVAIDPLIAGIDLSPVWDLLTNPKILKVFHACKQDMEVFFKVSGVLPTPIFDTQIAAMMLGLGEQIGYDNLIQRVVGQQVDKTSQFSDWSLRPLDPQQIAYALGDVIHHYAAYEKLHHELQARGRLSWVEEEMASLSAPELYQIDPEQSWQRLKIKNRTQPFLAALKCLAAWREQFAQERDLPRNRVLKDDTLIDIALRRPESPEAMIKLRGVSEGLAKGKTGAAIAQALKKAKTLATDQIPSLSPKPQPIPGAIARGEVLKTLLKICADTAQVAPRVLASTKEIEALARNVHSDLKCMSGWRYDLFGRHALGLLAGELWLGLKDGELAILSAHDVGALA